jgi:hypothetical protein
VQSDDIFRNKPTSATREFAELRQVFTLRQLGEAFGRDPDTMIRWAKRVPHTTESVVDRFWYVVHVATTQARWDLDETRWFLLSIQPSLGGRVPAELVREGALGDVLDAIADREQPSQAVEQTMDNPFARTIAPQPISSETIFGVPLAAPDLRGRARPIQGLYEDEDEGIAPFLTTRTAVAMAAGSLED